MPDLTAMHLIASDTNQDAARILDGFECPAILVTNDYRILATNERYLESFGEIEPGRPAHCFEVSHGYDRPCDQAGETCPLATCTDSRQKERVLHIHNTSRGKEYVDVEMLPILDDEGRPKFFVELLKPVSIASAESSTRQMVGRSPPFNHMVDMINLVAARDTAVLLLGESGTGKEMAASAIHQASPRHDRPLVTVECAGLTETLFESELFGHVKGAFTGAISRKAGLIEAAEDGTLFLDEIGDVPLGMQVKLLRLLETGTYRAVGNTEIKRARFRLICATHKNLPALIERGEFREDLYYRINVFPIELPPLRKRYEDIALIAKSVLEKISGGDKLHISNSAVKLLQQQSFPGNVRELRNLMERALIFKQSNVIDDSVIIRCLNDLPQIPQPRIEQQDIDLKTLEYNYLLTLMSTHQGDKSKVAKIAGISVRSLYRKLAEG
ncbi:sigma-54 interaction domain-containing protein [Porticoccus hydrocarbonoclasticus]|uniref:sigma-54 interaction domain-containing protein n=1 Tax=Porticoccus hydrocarbonoclasticus TaxID=1073414 RepID=UPI00190F0BF4|nr:sigma 54-interacting transcriptional regulator [Porticoccus hydrocarbonoclasticus]